MSQIIRDITEIARCGAQYRPEVLAPLGLKSCHASYLLAICANPGISQINLLPGFALTRVMWPVRLQFWKKTVS